MRGKVANEKDDGECCDGADNSKEREEAGDLDADPAPYAGGGAAPGRGYEVGAGGDEVHEDQLHAGAEVEEQQSDGEEDEAEYGDENKSDAAGYGTYAGG